MKRIYKRKFGTINTLKQLNSIFNFALFNDLEKIEKHLKIYLEYRNKLLIRGKISPHEILTNKYNKLKNKKDIMNGELVGRDKEITELLIKLVKEKIKPPQINIVATLKLECDAKDGVEIIKKALSNEDKSIEISYLSAPNYRLKITSKDYKTGELILKTFQENLNNFSKKNKVRFEMTR